MSGDSSGRAQARFEQALDLRITTDTESDGDVLAALAAVLIDVATRSEAGPPKLSDVGKVGVRCDNSGFVTERNSDGDVATGNSVPK